MPVHKREYIVNWCMILENVKVSFDLSEQIVSMATVYRIDLMGIYICFFDIIIMWLSIATFAETYITAVYTSLITEIVYVAVHL